MKTMKRFIAAVMAVTSVMALAPMSAFADTTDVTFDAPRISPAYTITIPATADLNAENPTATIKAENVYLDTTKHKQINVKLDSAQYVNTGDSTFIAKTEDGSSSVTYTIGKGDATTGVKVGDTVAEFTADGSQVLSFSEPTGATYAGKHTETLTFGISVESAAAVPTLTLGEMAHGGDLLNNGSGSETYYSPTFSEGQQVAVFYKNTSGQTVKVLSDALTASDISNEGKSATINVTIDDADKTQPVTYFYPATMAKDDGSINFNFTAQSGTEASLSTVRNCCKGSGAWDGNALPSVSMASQIAIWKLTMTGGGGMIMAQKVTVKVGGNKVAEASTSGVSFAYPIDIYLALNPATMGTGTLRIEADEFGTIYYYQKDGGVSLTAGKFYQSAVELKR